MSLVLGFGLEHSCPCPRKGCPWPWPRIFFVSLALSLASSLVSSTPPLVNTTKIFVHPYNQYLNCWGTRGNTSPHRELASPHRDLASPHRDLGAPPSRFEHWMVRQKGLILHSILAKTTSISGEDLFFFWPSPNFNEKALQFPAKTFYFFGVHSISATELRKLH